MTSTTRTRTGGFTAEASGVHDLGRAAEGAEQALDGPQRHQGQGLYHDEGRHLRLALDPVDEADGDLDDRRPGPPGRIGHLDLEPVAFGPDGVEIESSEQG